MNHLQTKIPLSITIGIFWAILTAVNICKPFHIDDTFHLEAAAWIMENPLQPMSGLVNWGDEPTPLYTHNQPPLFFYLIACTQFLFGNSETIMHLLVSLFTLMALIYFVRICRLLGMKNIPLLLGLFALGPAFVVNQNLMTDVPVLAMVLAFTFYLIRWQQQYRNRDLVVAAILVSLGLLIKYSLLPALITLILVILGSFKYRALWTVFIPLAILMIWSLWNLWEFDSIHILGRSHSGIHIGKVWSLLAALGSVTWFAWLCLHYFLSEKLARLFVLSILLMFWLSVPFAYFNLIQEGFFTTVLTGFFIFMGAVLFLCSAYMSIKKLTESPRAYLRSPNFTIALLIFSISSFLALFAPFQATRHVLLMIPFLLLLLNLHLDFGNYTSSIYVLVTTAILGILLGISDWKYADFYRTSIQEIKPYKQTVWSVGHWGWQWYSARAGMKIYSDIPENRPEVGDILVIPADISQQKISHSLVLDTLEFITRKPDFWTFFSTKDYASMYHSDINKPAWSLSNDPIDTIFVCRIREITPTFDFSL